MIENFQRAACELCWQNYCVSFHAVVCAFQVQNMGFDKLRASLLHFNAQSELFSPHAKIITNAGFFSSRAYIRLLNHDVWSQQKRNIRARVRVNADECRFAFQPNQVTFNDNKRVKISWRLGIRMRDAVRNNQRDAPSVHTDDVDSFT